MASFLCFCLMNFLRLARELAAARSRKSLTSIASNADLMATLTVWNSTHHLLSSQTHKSSTNTNCNKCQMTCFFFRDLGISCPPLFAQEHNDLLNHIRGQLRVNHISVAVEAFEAQNLTFFLEGHQ